MKLSLVAKSGRDLGSLDVPNDAVTVDNLMKLILDLAKEKKLKTKPIAINRQRITMPNPSGPKPVVLTAGKTLKDLGVKDGAVLTLKDLGPQIGYQTVFFWEYFGPMMIYPLFHCYREQVYGVAFTPCLAQRLALYYWTFHYAKRIAETFLVHRFSHGTMPIINLFRNSGYYWGFAAMVSYFINHPQYTSPDELRVQAGFALAMLCQVCNLHTHINLANLRKPGEKGYKIPKGFGFNWITCANYTFEIYGWFCFNVATQSLMGVVFMCAGAFQMIIWAGQKHKRLRDIFNGKDGMEKYPRRFKILPPFI